jgi:hypothetical protein
MKRLPPSAPVLLGLSALAVVGGFALVGPAGPTPPVPVPEATCDIVYEGEPKGGVSFVAPRRPVGPEAVAPVTRIGADWIAVLPYAFLGPDDEVRFDRERQWWGEGVEGVAGTIRMAHEQGLKVMLKPHVWAGRAGWVGDYMPATSQGWTRFEATYTDYILTFATLAETTGAELFVVGTELDRTVRERADFWHRLIDQVEERYRGPLTYAANWDGFDDVPFWDRMDYLGVDAFFPLSEDPTPGAAELQEAWRPIVAELAAACRQHQRPVLFTEFGYRSIDGAAGNQWELPPEGRGDVPSNLQAQVQAYEALFRTWWDEPWFAGGFLWKWFPDDDARADRLRADYTPQHKPVEEVIRRWFGEATADR